MGEYDYLQALFNNAEGGTLTFEQFEHAMSNQTDIKLANLATGNYVSKGKYDTEVSKLTSQITTLKNTVSERDIDLADVKSKLEKAGADETKLNDITAQLTNLQTKYDNDTKNYQSQLAHQSYEFAVKEFANSKEFTSKAAKRDFVQSMLAKNLQMEGDKILGAEDFVTAYATENDDAFVKKDDGQTPPPEPKPQFVAPTGQQNPPDGGKPNPFNFHFTGVRPEPKE